MLIRQALISDIPGMQIVRHLVKENVLSNPALVTDADCEEYICNRGRGWVCEIEGKIAGFAIADLLDDNIWALFVDPAFEKQGIGRELHDNMLEWYFAQGKKSVWLSTAPNTRAAHFYDKAGWKNVGMTKRGEIKFEMYNNL
ncbi:MAG: GNAT family N-acetyltransferase [Ferruginibacter sp.]